MVTVLDLLIMLVMAVAHQQNERVGRLGALVWLQNYVQVPIKAGV